MYPTCEGFGLVKECLEAGKPVPYPDVDENVGYDDFSYLLWAHLVYMFHVEERDDVSVEMKHLGFMLIHSVRRNC